MAGEMKCFVAEAIFQATLEIPRPDLAPLEERLLYLVRSDGVQGALDKAAALVAAKEHSYDNYKGERVIWTLRQLVEVSELIDQEIEDGAEIKSWLSGGEERQSHRRA
jgi:hypothetical protein